MILLTAATEQVSSPWYDSKLLHTLIGAFISISVLVVTQYLTEKREKVKYRQTILSWLTISNSSLFILIYKYSIDKEKINYEKLRKELERVGSFIYILPDNLKSDFIELIQIHQKPPEDYENNQDRIHPLLVSIVDKLNTYGVDAFGI